MIKNIRIKDKSELMSFELPQVLYCACSLWAKYEM